METLRNLSRNVLGFGAKQISFSGMRVRIV